MITRTPKAIHFYLTTTIREGLVQNIILQISNMLVRDFSKSIKEINFYISTKGGSASEGIALYNYLKSLKNLIINTWNFSTVDSIGSIIYLAGKNRYALKNTSFHIHGPSFNTPPEYQQNFTINCLNELVSDLKEISEQMKKIYINNTNYKSKEINKFFNSGERLSFDKAKSSGIITKEVDAIKEIITSEPIFSF